MKRNYEQPDVELNLQEYDVLLASGESEGIAEDPPWPTLE